MKYEQEFKVGAREMGLYNRLTNYGFLSFLEDIASNHSDLVGYGVKDIGDKHKAWLLMDWKLNVVKRPSFGEKVKVKTWATEIEKPCFYVYRNFEVLNELNEIIATATSKWVLFDTEFNKIVNNSESE